MQLRDSANAILRNTGYNLAANVTPVLLAVAVLPILIPAYGPDRYGLLCLAWTAISYFSLLDIGIGRALTQLVAQRIALESAESVGTLVLSGVFLAVIAGAGLTLVL